MILRNIDFGSVLNASGAQGFFGEGYPFHDYLKKIPGFTFDGMTFVAKTTTIYTKKGNIKLREDGTTPVEFKPDCIIIKPFNAIVLNAVGLSGPGAKHLLEDGRWQKREDPFFLSFMSVKNSPDERLRELSDFVKLLKVNQPNFSAEFGLEINFSCPNVGLDPTELVDEVDQSLSVAGNLSIPLVPKFNILLPPEIAGEIAEHENCDGICISNTIPWRMLADDINWDWYFGSSTTSPLDRLGYGGGGLSGRPLFPLVRRWVEKFRSINTTTSINAGGGILNTVQALQMIDAGANAVSLGTMAILRPWRMEDTIRTVNNYYTGAL